MSEQNAREAHSSFDSVDHGFMINHGKTLTVTPKFLEEPPAADAVSAEEINDNFQHNADIVISNTEKTKKEKSESEEILSSVEDQQCNYQIEESFCMKPQQQSNYFDGLKERK